MKDFRIKRRTFLKSLAFVGGAVAAGEIPWLTQLYADEDGFYHLAQNAYPFDRPENVIYSTCLQCHTACTIKGKIYEGVLVKIEGNPYSPMNMWPQLPYDTPPEKAVKYDARLCPKGQAGIQSLYDPYRLRKVLKRKPGTKRGEGQWITISFEQAIEEIVNGGNLFGEGHVPGLREIWAVRDPKLMKQLKEDAKAVAEGKMSLSEFKRKHRAHLDKLIDPDHPDLGPKNNQFVFLAGRIEHGRKEFSKRWLKDAFGSVNWYEHTTVCEQSHHIAYKEMTYKYKNGKWGHGKEHMKPDVPNCEFVIFFGTSPFECNFGPTPWAAIITNAQAKRGFKYAVVDPRLSNTAAKATYWVPIKPGTDAALVLGMIRWIIENKRYNEAYLRNANRTAARRTGDTTWTNATHLVKINPDGTATELLRGSDIGIGSEHEFVASVNGKLVAFDPYARDGEPVVGDLFAEGEVNGIRYKTAFALLRDYVMSKSLEEWARICEVDPEMIVRLADEFTSHGRRAVAEMYRGPVQHTNGYYNGCAIITLNLLIGNPDWKGGLSAGGGHWHEMGGKKNQPFPLKKMHPGKLGHFGVTLTREHWHYEKTTLFKKYGYPAKRPWYPYTGNVYQEVLPSAADGYPYPIKALFLHKGTPAYSIPASTKQLEILKDPGKIPLIIACDIVIGESSQYADYIFPDMAIWERWGTPHTTPAIPVKVSKTRQPMVEALTEKVRVFGQEMPCSMEAVMLAIAEKLGLPGYGKDGFGPGWDFRKPEDWYLKMVANIALEGSPVPKASDREIEIFRRARRHLSRAVFDEAYWRKTVGGEGIFRRVVYVLNRGGRFEDASRAYEGKHMRHRFASQFNLFVENVAKGRHSFTGKHFSGIPIYEPAKDASGKPVTWPEEYAFQLFTFKPILVGQSRTICNYWTQIAEFGTNYVMMNPQDMRRLGLKDGDVVRLISPSNPEGVIRVRNGLALKVQGAVRGYEGIRPGTVAVCHGYGRFGYGAYDQVVDGKRIPGDVRRAVGLSANPVMLADPVLKNVCLSDPIGGSCSFYDSRVKVVKVSGTEGEKPWEVWEKWARKAA